MKTKQVYYESPYLKSLTGKVIGVEEKGNLFNVILDQTIFYPEGGGQPSDRGVLSSKNWSAKVLYVHTIDGEIIHQISPDGEIKINDAMESGLDWNWRYKYMKIHSAGHLVHDTLMTMIKGLKPIRGSHGKKAFLEYEGNIEASLKGDLEKNANDAINKNLPIITKEATYDELAKECQFVLPNLPKDKILRMIKIGDYPAMPDGGVHVKSTKEIGKIWIINLTPEEGKVIIRYGVSG